jgi:hypothetical protein
VWVECANDAENVPDAEPIAETGNCAYEIFVKSLYGCPLECGYGPDPTSSSPKIQLCSNHGICDFDTAQRKSKCFCNDGWVGANCGSKPTAAASGLSSTGAVLVAVVVFLIITLGVL